jgi:hypothetical protein
LRMSLLEEPHLLEGDDGVSLCDFQIKLSPVSTDGP